MPNDCHPPPDPTLAQVASELAWARVRLAFLRADMEFKYREDQARVPKGGQPYPGSFANEGRGSSRRSVDAARITAPAAARVLTRPAARAAAGAAGAAAGGIGVTGAVAGSVAAAAPMAVGAGAMSRVTGLATHYMTGAPVTPFLHIPGDPNDLKPVFLRGRRELSPEELRERDESCEKLYDKDMEKCSFYSKNNAGKAGYSGKQI